MNATLLDLRYRTKHVLNAVERGETVILLSRGKQKARILPLDSSRETSQLTDSEAFGLWKDRRDLRDVAKVVRDLRKGRFHDL